MVQIYNADNEPDNQLIIYYYTRHSLSFNAHIDSKFGDKSSDVIIFGIGLHASINSTFFKWSIKYAVMKQLVLLFSISMKFFHCYVCQCSLLNFVSESSENNRRTQTTLIVLSSLECDRLIPKSHIFISRYNETRELKTKSCSTWGYIIPVMSSINTTSCTRKSGSQLKRI